MSILQEGSRVDVYKVQYLIKQNEYTETYRVVNEDGHPYFLKLYVLKRTPAQLVLDEQEVLDFLKTQKIKSIKDVLLLTIDKNGQVFLQKYNDVAKERDVVAHRLRFATLARVGEGISALALMESRIKSTDPRTILSMGYVLVTGKDNKVLKTVGRVAVGDRIGVRFQDGSILAKVDEVVDERLDNNKTQIA